MSNVANVIFDQIGGNGFAIMTGAKQFVGGADMLQFSLPRYPGLRVNKVRITLTPDDLYDVDFFNLRGVDCKLISQAVKVHAGDLCEIFEEHTGLYTKL